MTCIEIKQILDQSFGQTEHEPEVDEHLTNCSECREYWEQLVNLSEALPGDEQFSFDDATIDSLIEKVEDAIHPSTDITSITTQETKNITQVNLMRWLPAAAAVLLVVGVGIGGYFVGRTNLNPATATINQPTALLLGSVDESDYDEPDDPTFEVLLSQFTTDRPFDASEKLLDDITDEEMEYLTQNFDVGDLL